MINFDFHRVLSPPEFENFCRDLLEIREPGIKFTTYTLGRDGGIDIKATNTEKKIIVQCKLYKPANYRVMRSKLKKEAAKCKELTPARYIFCTNIELTPEQAYDIKALFGGYIKNEEDIIDGCKLNKYLGQERYKGLLKSYLKLLVADPRLVDLVLEKIIHQKYYHQTASFLRAIAVKHDLILRTAQIPHLIEQLEKNKVIILTGNPGVGKTTT
ncbi:MAG: restriction endonuclease, partial [Bacteroidota bacterium]